MAALGGRCGVVRQHIRALAQDPVDQVFQNRHTTVRMQALAVHDPHAAKSRLPRILQETTQHRFGLHGIAVVQVDFILRRIFAAS